jgi:hypothetical protein
LEIEKLYLILLPILITAFFASIIPRKLREIQQFTKDAAEFRDAFFDELIKFERACTIEIEGTGIYKVLFGAFQKHSTAVHKFQACIKGKRLRNINFAWHQYQYPDNKTDSGPFGYYILPDENGNVKMIEPKFVYDKIDALLTNANP